MVKSEELLQSHYCQLLNDNELLSAIIYTRKLINRKDNDSILEFDDLANFFFKGNNEAAIKTLQNIDARYQKEYFKRRQN